MLVSRDFFLLKKIVHNFIKQGKKAKAVNFFFLTLALLKKKGSRITPYILLHKALLNIRPVLTIQRLRKSSRLLNLPKLIGEEQQTRLALLWFKKSVNKRKERKIENRLHSEFFDSFKGKSLTVTKKRATYSTILVSRPLLHLLVIK